MPTEVLRVRWVRAARALGCSLLMARGYSVAAVTVARKAVGEKMTADGGRGPWALLSSQSVLLSS